MTRIGVMAYRRVDHQLQWKIFVRVPLLRTCQEQNSRHFLFSLLTKQVDHGDAPCCKDDLEDTLLQRSLMTQGKNPVEVVHKTTTTLHPQQVDCYRSDVSNTKLSQVDP